ncbi:pantoate--beta-alanine ligase [Legionella oakridgensis]|uniref:pantoate--beta-alanine ligase n=1 Tax=Legionella oakridgensis TaxID=29423 RepID=UPI0003DE4C41|nr:pantoate--beta-alanine ligase [Legionella oakridgensis]ETO94156.1 pantothenate synthetase [Legionella oakridgensis RV-2-2007]
MNLFHQLDEWRAFRRELPSHCSLGFVPTMGNLHAGHTSLFTISQQENDYTVASIFVNPTQFNQSDDYNRYPRTLNADLDLLTSLGVDYCLLPEEKTMYADGYRYQLQENQHTQLMEGRQRPGHFTGVLTVVMKLLNLVKPNRAYFGEKDYQQFQLIRDMVSAFFMDIEIKSCPTIRETSGLAFSSRNNRLNSEQRKLADQFAHVFHQPLSQEQIITTLQQLGIEVEYIEDHQNRRFAAVNIGGIRLIDNYLLP